MKLVLQVCAELVKTDFSDCRHCPTSRLLQSKPFEAALQVIHRKDTQADLLAL
ncbi:hypothetical protein [Nostoc sp. FACHB-892]|nr:hypothetical protein [Nostoc sp. FACHB-892]